MDENNILNKADELLDSTSEDKRIKFEADEAENAEGQNSDTPAAEIPVNPIEEAEEVKPAEEPKQQIQANQSICIIDETSTTVVIEQGPDISADELAPKKETAAPKVKEPIKFKPGHIVILVLVGLIALWTAIYTVDHTLAANGLSPSVFCRLDETEESSNIVRYKGLGYTIEYTLDNDGALVSQKCQTVIGSLLGK